jgi:membrane-associated phospholipid phosphatase
MPAALLALVLLAAPVVDAPHDLRSEAVVASSAAAAALLVHLLQPELVAPRCRWCEPDRFDRWAHDRLRWERPERAVLPSDLLQLAVPLGAAAWLAAPAARGDGRRALEDLAVVAEAYAVSVLGTELAKVAASRLRPRAADGTGPSGAVAERVSFWSGHTSSVFAAAAATGTVLRLRGDERWPWVMGAGLALAAATGWLRVAADRHWATDVLAGAAFGAAVGLALPPLEFGGGAVRLVPAPGGLALVF